MLPSAGDELRVKPGGILIAVVAFALTRVLLIGVVYSRPAASTSTTLLRLAPLVLGLGIVVYGVNLSVSTHDSAYARTVSRWFLVGSLGIFALVATGTAEDATLLATFSTDIGVTNAVLGGGTGGILVGVRSARAHRRRRAVARQSDQLVLLNRVLRHEVLNAITAIQGHAALLRDGAHTDRSHEAISTGADRIERTIGQVRERRLSRPPQSTRHDRGTRDACQRDGRSRVLRRDRRCGRPDGRDALGTPRTRPRGSGHR